ncbi:ribonuclease R [Planctomycetota bacterium]
MPEIFKKRIIKFLNRGDYTPVKLSQLARALGVSSEDYRQFKSAFEQLRSAGSVIIGSGNRLTLPAPTGRVIGTFRANPKGFGFVIPLEPNSHGDLFIPPKGVSDAMTGDIVEAVVKKDKRRKGRFSQREEKTALTGQIIQVLERSQNKFVGTLMKQQGQWVVQPDGSSFIEPISVDDVTAKGAHQKDKVVVEIISWPTEKFLSRGVIVEVLGKAGRYESEIKSIICQYHIPCEFDESCYRQAQKCASAFNPDQLDNREDITDKLVITIDPPDAKDFDDAISIEKDGNDNWVLGIHIADVSSFVLPDTALGNEARIRGNSVYLPGKTIPMLPEVLSNGICSLQPGQRRFCKSIYLTYDKQARVISRRFANSVICSTQRLTYRQADKALKGRTKDVKVEVIKLLTNMEKLSRLIEKRREDNGMLHLDLPETELVLDKAGRVSDVHPADTSYPHTIIEMFMVEANEAVAAIMDKLNLPLMRRIHPEPDKLSMRNLSKLAKTLGFNLPRVPDRFAIQRLLESVQGNDLSLAVNLLVLRSFEKAQYSPLHIGHFALASTYYCHFTSPIRRYADLLVHRVLEKYLQKEPNTSQAGQDLTEIGKHITFTEQRAEDAERELKTVLILQMLSQHISDELDCVVTGLVGFGVFVQSRKFGVEGLIRMADLGPGIWKYNQKTNCIVETSSGQTVHLGQPMKVRIVSVNVPARQLNVSLLEPLVTLEPKRKTTRKPSKKNSKSRTRKRPKRKR